MLRWRTFGAGALFLGTVTFAPTRQAAAQIDAVRLVESLRAPQDPVTGAAWSRAELPRAFLDPETQRLATIVRITDEGAARGLGLRPIAPGFAVLDASVDDVLSVGRRQGIRLGWSPPLHPLLDRVQESTRAEQARKRFDTTGSGVVVGIVDTGVELSHPTFRHTTGSTRIAWLIDFSRQEGMQTSLEQEYCGPTSAGCAIYSAADLDELVATASREDEPQDDSGHGTHVASLAAGNGGAHPAYAGLAPEATLIVARVTRAGGAIVDADVLRAVAFIYDRARELGMPAVVNLSLGNDFGAHDGSSALEQALAAFVGPREPGRALVVAGGNSAVVVPESEVYPAPLGIHTEVHVPRDSSTLVPLLTPNTGYPTRATLFVWIAGRPGDELAVGLDRQAGPWIAPLPPGASGTFEGETYEVTIVNGNRDQEKDAKPSDAVLVIDGTWASGTLWAIRLEGRGSPRLWVQSEGDLQPGGGPDGALFPRAAVAGTINVPATHPELIAVGATTNRTTWPVRRGALAPLEGPGIGEPCVFSSAGPNANGLLKPDLVAPGGYVIGAMARSADPETDDRGLFAKTSACIGDDYCLVVDDEHAVSAGTSMAAPLVTGAAALLLEQDPQLTQDEIRFLLQAGAARPRSRPAHEQQLGAGVLDVTRSLDALGGGVREAPHEGRLVLADTFAHPDESWPLFGLVQLRSGSGRPVDGFVKGRLRLSVSNGKVVGPLERLAPGLWQFAVAAPAGSGGEFLEVSLHFADRLLAQERVPIAVDRSVAEHEVLAYGGCGLLANGQGRLPDAPWSFPLLAALWWIRRARRRRPRCCSSPRRCG